MLRPPPSFPFLSAESRVNVLAAYDRRVADMAGVQRLSVETRDGRAHVLAAGRPDGPPLIVLHGFNMGAARNLGLFLPASPDDAWLGQRFRIFAPDTPGQPGPTAPARLDFRRNGYGRWLCDVMDGLGVASAPVVGISFGAAVALDTAALAPHRISRAALLVPAGIVPVDRLRALTRLVVPALLYRLTSSRWFLRRQLEALATVVTDDLVDYFDLLARNIFPVLVPPPVFSAAALRRFHAPTLVAAASDDIFFPLARLRAQSQRVLPGLSHFEALPGKHIPAGPELRTVNDLLLRFFD